MDWCVRVPDDPANACGLGAMESNGNNLTANQMKKRGMVRTVRGSNLMAKAIQICRNGELARYCRDLGARDSEVAGPPLRISDWMDASVPVLKGPSVSNTWASGLRRLGTWRRLLNWDRLPLSKMT